MTVTGAALGGGVRRLLLRGVLTVLATALTACGLDAQPQPEPIPPDRLPHDLVEPADPGTAADPGTPAASPST